MRSLAIVMLLATTAEARGSRCHDDHSVVGYAHCVRFGGWGSGSAMYWELGPSYLRFDPGHLDTLQTLAMTTGTQTYHAYTTDDRVVRAAALEFRATIGLPSRLYVAIDFTLGLIGTGSHLAATRTLEDGTSTFVEGASTGSVVQSAVAVGIAEPFGPFSSRTELVPGFRFGGLNTTNEAATVTFSELILYAREHVDAWVTPNITVGVMAGVDLVHGGDYTLGASIGLHALPFDGGR